jgi:hypothetical protein
MVEYREWEINMQIILGHWIDAAGVFEQKGTVFISVRSK